MALRYRARIPSSRSTRETLAILRDFTSSAEWDPSVVSAERLDEGPIHVGSRFLVVVRFATRDVSFEYVIIDLVEDESVTLRAETSSLVSLDTVGVRTVDGSVELDYDAQLDLKGPRRLLEPVMGLAFRRLCDRAAAGLRDVLSRPPSAEQGT